MFIRASSNADDATGIDELPGTHDRVGDGAARHRQEIAMFLVRFVGAEDPRQHNRAAGLACNPDPRKGRT
jgi:hypothetical protein